MCRCMGIDVAKNHLDVAVHQEKTWRTTNDEDGITQLVTTLTERHPTLVVLEATGGYERAVTAALAAAKLPER